MIDFYSRAKTLGHEAQDVLESVLNKHLKDMETELGRKLTDEEEEEFIEGFWNGVI